MANYQTELTKYRVDSQAWASMSDAEQQRAHKAAEAGRLGLFSACLGALVGATIWGLFNRQHPLDKSYACAMAAAGAGVFYIVPPLRNFAGHLGRAILMAIVYGFVSTIVVSFMAGTSNYVASHLESAKVIGILLAVAIAGIAEFAGLHHAKATPKEPTAPKP